jgi:hypothetical protein
LGEQKFFEESLTLDGVLVLALLENNFYQSHSDPLGLKVMHFSNTTKTKI